MKGLGGSFKDRHSMFDYREPFRTHPIEIMDDYEASSSYRFRYSHA